MRHLLESSLVISGRGALCSLGASVPEAARALLAGETGVVENPDWRGLPHLRGKLFAPAKWPGPERKLDRKLTRSSSRMTHMALFALQEALAEAQLTPELLRQRRVIIIGGSTAGSQSSAAEFISEFQRQESAYPYCQQFLKTMGHTVVSHLAMALGSDVPVLGLSAACATGAQALVLGANLLASGSYDLAICVGADELDPYTQMVFDNVGAASTLPPQQTPRPFDRGRDGIVLSEGAGVLILEPEAQLRERGVSAQLHLLGVAQHRAGEQPTFNDRTAITKVMRAALDDAGLAPADVGFVKAHATGTREGDAEEFAALDALFCERALPVPVTSLKGHLGHALAGSGPIELALLAEALRVGTLPETKHFVAHEVAGLKVSLSGEQRRPEAGVVLVNSFGFGGVVTSLVVAKERP